VVRDGALAPGGRIIVEPRTQVRLRAGVEPPHRGRLRPFDEVLVEASIEQSSQRVIGRSLDRASTRREQFEQADAPGQCRCAQEVATVHEGLVLAAKRPPIYR
jgi:hypothetical protein